MFKYFKKGILKKRHRHSHDGQGDRHSPHGPPGSVTRVDGVPPIAERIGDNAHRPTGSHLLASSAGPHTLDSDTASPSAPMELVAPPVATDSQSARTIASQTSPSPPLTPS